MDIFAKLIVYKEFYMKVYYAKLTKVDKQYVWHLIKRESGINFNYQLDISDRSMVGDKMYTFLDMDLIDGRI